MSAILQLAEFLGIQSSYHDIWGEEVFATDQTRAALLNAMGLIFNQTQTHLAHSNNYN